MQVGNVVDYMSNQSTVQAMDMSTTSAEARRGYAVLMIRAPETLVLQKEYTAVSTFFEFNVSYYQ